MSHPSVQIRHARPADVAAIATLLTDTFYNTGWTSWLAPLLHWGLCQDLNEHLASPQPPYACLVAIQTAPGPVSTLVGSVELSVRALMLSTLSGKTVPYLTNLAIHPSLQHQGIGRQLLHQCERIARDWQFEDLFLHVHSKNQDALKFYQRIGYRDYPIPTAAWISPWLQRHLLYKQLC
jgi:ribosomal protein S18 acetylase RimI-like enzyme